MQELQQSLKWVPEFEIVDRIRKEEKKIREEAIRIEREKAKITEGKALEKGKQEKASLIAKGMKAKGYSIKEIIELTGLTKQEIDKL
jgi:DNA repair protein RadC